MIRKDEDYPNADSSNNYSGPSVAEMISTHTIADNIIQRHFDDCPILGPGELLLLRRFVYNPASRLEILRDCDMLDMADGEGGKDKHGSLAGYLVARHSAGPSCGPSALDDREIRTLKEWFEGGEPNKRMEGAVETGRSS